MPPDTRLRIIRAAMELFAIKGFNSTSVADLLSRTQINSGSLYHFFPGKQDVLIGVLEAYRDGIYPMLLEPAWEGIADPVERIFALLNGYRTMLLESDCTYGCPIGSLALELHEPDLAVRRLLMDNFNAWTGAVGDCLAEARSGGHLPASTDIAALAEFILTTMEGAVMQARTHREIAHYDRSVAQLRAYLDLLAEKAVRQDGVKERT